MPSLTFEALLHLFQAEGTYQEVIKHGLSDFLRAGDDVYLPAVADHLDRARDSSDQRKQRQKYRLRFRLWNRPLTCIAWEHQRPWHRR